MWPARNLASRPKVTQDRIPWTQASHPARLRAGTELALALLLILQAGWIGFRFVEPPRAPADASAAPSAAPVDAGILARFDAFFPDPGPGKETARDADAGALRLFGVQVEGGRSIAIIGLADGRQIAVSVGDDVEPGLTLRAVARDHVILVSGSAPVRLAFDQQDPASPPSPATAGRAISPGQPPPPQRHGAIARVPARTVPAPPPGPAALLAQGMLKPRLRGLGISGFTIGEGAPGGALTAAGLQPGDVVLAVNGVELNSVDAARGVADQLKSAASAEIRYERNGQVRSARVGSGS